MCSENPDSQADDHSDHHCFVTLIKNDTTGELTPNLKRCIVGDCHGSRCLAEPFLVETSIYSCCCNTNLCNVDVEMLPVSTISPGCSIKCL